MSLIVHDFECEACSLIEERIVDRGTEHVECSKCGNLARKIISSSQVNAANQDAPWIRTILEVVDKDSPKPHVREFLKNPTRDNYKRWMKGEGLRHLEDGEARKPKPPDVRKVMHEVLSRAQERRRIELYR